MLNHVSFRVQVSQRAAPCPARSPRMVVRASSQQATRRDALSALAGGEECTMRTASTSALHVLRIRRPPTSSMPPARQSYLLGCKTQVNCMSSILVYDPQRWAWASQPRRRPRSSSPSTTPLAVRLPFHDICSIRGLEQRRKPLCLTCEPRSLAREDGTTLVCV